MTPRRSQHLAEGHFCSLLLSNINCLPHFLLDGAQLSSHVRIRNTTYSTRSRANTSSWGPAIGLSFASIACACDAVSVWISHICKLLGDSIYLLVYTYCDPNLNRYTFDFAWLIKFLANLHWTCDRLSIVSGLLFSTLDSPFLSVIYHRPSVMSTPFCVFF